MHRRWLIAPPEDRTQLVVDGQRDRRPREVQTSCPSESRREPLRCRTSEPRPSAVLQILHAATVPLGFDDRFGDEANAFGWWSDRLESRVPAWWLGAVCRADLPVVIATLITPADGVPTSDLLRHDATQRYRGDLDGEYAARSVVVRVDGSAVTHCGPSAGTTDDKSGALIAVQTCNTVSGHYRDGWKPPYSQ